ncbi:MAG: hypothetical protein GYA17_20825 [Chloroflexi bacterium]|nr:hypothetical protein [Anaerolineaceae bacterium]NMB90812.1 hypothetical protein [Chloroflexota bacterium]
MVSTVTTSTVSTITLAGSFAIVGILALLALLILKELTTASNRKRTVWLGKVLNIGIAPLLIVFLLVAVWKVVEVLQ